MVGIFWLFQNRVILDASLLSAAEAYGDCLNHHLSHIDYWAQHQLLGDLPRDIEYEEYPRGRVVFHTKTRRYSFCADRCILRKKSIVSRIMKAMHLTAAMTDVLTDSHYRCLSCLNRQRELEPDTVD
jgi:hypothetical protein